MKLSSGSIQRKGRCYYYVSRAGGRQRWIALKTDDLRRARARALKFLPGDNDETTWLRHLARLGDEARQQLHLLERHTRYTWDNVWPAFAAATPVPAASRATYRHWLDRLAAAAPRMPGALTVADARVIADALRRTHLSADRMLRFYRRVWTTLGLDATVWRDEIGRPVCPDRAPGFYRRLTTNEVRRVIATLRAAATPEAPAYADMVVIGYFTGLRLSDVAELHVDEVLPDADYLRLQPNKVRHSKPRLLLIPLVRAARTIVRRRRDDARAANDGGFLFSARARMRPSRPLAAAFRAAGVVALAPARASFHSLRATFISLMDEAGVPPHVTDAITGHAGGGMHARYTQPSAAALTAAVLRALPPLEG